MMMRDGWEMTHSAMVMNFEASSGASRAAAIFEVMGNDRRIQILSALLLHGELNVNVLAQMVGLSQSALSQHLKRLRHCDLVSTRRDRQNIYYRVVAPVVEELLTTYMRVERTALSTQDISSWKNVAPQ